MATSGNGILPAARAEAPSGQETSSDALFGAVAYAVQKRANEPIVVCRCLCLPRTVTGIPSDLHSSPRRGFRLPAKSPSAAECRPIRLLAVCCEGARSVSSLSPRAIFPADLPEKKPSIVPHTIVGGPQSLPNPALAENFLQLQHLQIWLR